jgi:GTP cyclohydrolase II
MVSDLRLGLPVVLTDADGAAMILPIETLSQARYHALNGMAHFVMTSRRAAALGQQAQDGAVTLIPVPKAARLDWLKALADPSRHIPVASSLPLADDQVPTDMHHAAIRLVKMAELVPAALVVRSSDAMDTAIRHNLGVLCASDALEQAGAPRDPQPVSNARVPMFAANAGRLHVFRNHDGGSEHYAIQVGDPDPSQPVLVRLHSACFTGDVLGSLKCDCGPQLQAALAAMNEAGSGILLYLNQEGRGIGLANKMRAYSLQDQGLDTVEANHALGFEDDERDFRTGAALLYQMGIGQVRLMTNNPAKIARLDSEGIKVVERVPLQVGRGPENTRYLDTKASKSGHMM